MGTIRQATMLCLVNLATLLLLKGTGAIGSHVPDQPGWVCSKFDDRQCSSTLSAVGLGEISWWTTAQNGAIFWSTDITNANPNPNMLAAQAWAVLTGKKTLEMTEGGRNLEAMGLPFTGSFPQTVISPVNGVQVVIQNACESANYWNCASKVFAEQASGIMNAFARQLRVDSPYPPDFVPTFYNIELPPIPKKNEDAEMVFHYNSNKGSDIWYDKKHYTSCTPMQAEHYSLYARNTYIVYQEKHEPYPDYGYQDDYRTEHCQ